MAREIHIYGHMVDFNIPQSLQTTPARVTDCGCGGDKTADAKLAAIMDSLTSGRMSLKDANLELIRWHINGTIIWDGTVYSRIVQ